MAEEAPAAPTTAKQAKKKTAVKRKKPGASLGELVVKAVSASKERSGVSLPALKKALAASGYDVEKNNSRVKLAIKSLVTKGTLVQTKGTGASGSFKLNKKQTEAPQKKVAVKKAPPKAKKPAAAKKSKPVLAKKKKPAATPAKKKKPAVKKSPKKAAKPKATPKKVTKKVTKSPKKPAAPKRATKSPKKAKAVKAKTTKPKAAKTRKPAPKKK